MIQKIRKSIRYLLPVVAAVLVIGLILSRVVSINSIPDEPEVTISANEAAEYVGTPAEVCGTVESANYLPNINGQPTFLNLDKPHPNQLFTAVIFGDNRNRFRFPPEEEYLNRSICVTGTIRMHQGVPQIIVTDPGQISISEH